MGEVKQINIKNWTYYFYNDIIDLKNFKSNLLKVDKRSYKNMVFRTFYILQLKRLMIAKKIIV